MKHANAVRRNSGQSASLYAALQAITVESDALAVHRHAARKPLAGDPVMRRVIHATSVRFAAIVMKTQIRNGRLSSPNTLSNSRKNPRSLHGRMVPCASGANKALSRLRDA